MWAVSLDVPLKGAHDWTPDGPLGEMTPLETRRLVELEQVIDAGMHTFLTVGNALAEVRNGRLYREHFDTFEFYCSCRWALSRSRAYEMMAAAEVVSAMADTDGPVPVNERQARALAAVPPEERADVMAAVAAKGKPTAAAIADEVKRRSPEPEPASVVWVCGDCLTMVPEASDLTEGLCVDCRRGPDPFTPQTWTCPCGTVTGSGLVDGLCIPCWHAAQREQPPAPAPAPAEERNVVGDAVAKARIVETHLDRSDGHLLTDTHMEDALASPRGLRLHLRDEHDMPTRGLTFVELQAAHDSHHQDHGSVSPPPAAPPAAEAAEPLPAQPPAPVGAGAEVDPIARAVELTEPPAPVALTAEDVKRFCVPVAMLGRALRALPAPADALAVLPPEVIAEYDQHAADVVEWAREWKKARRAPVTRRSVSEGSSGPVSTPGRHHAP